MLTRAAPADLRWNALRTGGAQAILETLQHNRALTSVLLAGNGVDLALTRAIGGPAFRTGAAAPR
jgi:hypothetical protein